uniref:Sushi domain-containing protein n=1 Tax=Anabas testudineus TaxID=64144 RepID=A0A7N5ZSL5_ANATE
PHFPKTPLPPHVESFPFLTFNASLCFSLADVPCGDPPSFPNARLQGHTGFDMGDELLYTCVPGYVMPSGQTCVSLCVSSDESEVHIDYEDTFTVSDGGAERHD